MCTKYSWNFYVVKTFEKNMTRQKDFKLGHEKLDDEYSNKFKAINLSTN